ncbi:MAG TPA: protein kinase [Kofleriaceae bacterium]
MGETPEVLGPYVIYERIGAGGMATVHRAEHVGVAGFRRPVALKRLLPHVADEPAMLEMFIHEARLASHLHHANVAATYDLGKVDDTYFIAMEYVPGPTLTQIMKQCGTVTGPMPVPIVLTILQQLLDALDHAHNLSDEMGVALGIIHRDISPSNIIVSTSGLVKLIDFGIAKASTGGVQTQTGMIKGKYAYIAPEYMQGHLDSRADLFGVGIIAHELLATRRLFNAASDYETLERLRSLPVVPPSRVNAQVPDDLDDIVLTALQRDPEQRWQSASAMRTALTNVARTIKGGIVSNQQLTEWVEQTFAQLPRNQAVMSTGLARVIDTLDDSENDGEDDLTRARRVDRDASASDAADPLIPPPAPSTPGSRARTRLGRVTAEPPMDPYETMTGDKTADKKWLAEKPRSSPNIVRRSGQMGTPSLSLTPTPTPLPEPPVPSRRAFSEDETPAPDLAARAKMLASRTADLAAASRSAQFAAQTVVSDPDTGSIDTTDTEDKTSDATGDLTINRILQPAKLGGRATPVPRTADEGPRATEAGRPAKEPVRRRLDASEYEIEMERVEDSVIKTLPAPSRDSSPPRRPSPPATSRPPLPTSAESPSAMPRRAPRPSTKELSPRDRLSMQLTVDEDAETPQPERISSPPSPTSPPSRSSPSASVASRSAGGPVHGAGSRDTSLDASFDRSVDQSLDQSLDQALGSLDATLGPETNDATLGSRSLDETQPRERESMEDLGTLARAPAPIAPGAARGGNAASPPHDRLARTLGGVGVSPSVEASRSVEGSRSVGGGSALSRALMSPTPLSDQDANARTIAGSRSAGGDPGSRSVGGGSASSRALMNPSGAGSGGVPPQRDSPMPLGSPPTPPPRNAGSPSSAPPFGGPPPMPMGGPPSPPMGGSSPPPAPTNVINPSAGVAPSRGSAPSQAPPFGSAPPSPPHGSASSPPVYGAASPQPPLGSAPPMNAFAATHPAQPSQGAFPPAPSSPNAFAPVAPTLMVAPLVSPASVINPSAPYDPSANRGSNPPSQISTRGAPSQPPPMRVMNPSAQVINPSAPVINPSAPYNLSESRGSNPPSQVSTRGAPSQPPPMCSPSAPHAATQIINPSAPFTPPRPGPSHPPPRPGPSQPPPFGAPQLVVPTAMPLGGPSSLVAERAALIPSLPQRATAPIVAARPSGPSAKTIVASPNLNVPAVPSAASASTVIADVQSIPPVVPRESRPSEPPPVARESSLDRATPANRATVVEAPVMDERAKRPSQMPEQNFARALVLPDVPPVAAFPEDEDSGVMLVAPGATVEEEKDRKSKKRVDDEKPVEERKQKKVALPAAPDGPRRWPWFVLVIVLLAVGAGAYVYFFGFDLPQL